VLLPDVETPPEVLAGIIDGGGLLNLNRLAVLNALDLATVRALTRQLTAPVLAAVERHFGLSSVADILVSLAGETDRAVRPWAERTLGLRQKRSPLMLLVTFEQLQRGRRLGLGECFRMERTMAHCFAHGDPMEVIRALRCDDVPTAVVAGECAQRFPPWLGKADRVPAPTLILRCGEAGARTQCSGNCMVADRLDEGHVG
jgi:hypothetical protein